MICSYVSGDDGITRREGLCTHGLITVNQPTDSELQEVSTAFCIDRSRLAAATDTDEPSRWEKEGGVTYLIVDVPYRDAAGFYDTTPLMMIRKDDVTITLGIRPTGIIRRYLAMPGIALGSENAVEFETNFLHMLTKEYQQILREIDRRRRSVEENIMAGKGGQEDVATLHGLENSLVYIITSLRGCNTILDLMRNSESELPDRKVRSALTKVEIENRQAVEMASVYREILESTTNLLSTEMDLKLNRTMKLLAVLTILLTIPMIISGMYGMNVDLPFQGEGAAFGAIVITTLVLDGLALFVMWKRKIL